MIDFLKRMINYICGSDEKKNELEREYISKEIPRLKEQLVAILKEQNNQDGVVVSLQGSWGIGKTYFWNDFAKHTWNENQQVYISLFGKHSLDEIKKQIILKVYDRNKIAKFIEKNPIIGKIIETKWGVDASLFASAFSKDTFEGIVLCFDDFERISSNLSISEILGFIAELKEQHKCKIVIINNNDSLKEQDCLNHKKVLKKKAIVKDERASFDEKMQFGSILNEYETIEKFFISQTNNQEIFDKFSEKIIDYRLYYEPHFSDNLNLVKDESLKFVNWELIEELLSRINEVNKQCNIRFMKQLVFKLKLLELSIDNTINERIANSLVLHIFKKVFEEQRIQIDNFDLANIDTLLKFLDDVLKKHYLEKENFDEALKKLNKEINTVEDQTNIYKMTKDRYKKYVYDLKYDDNSFVTEFYNIFEDNKNDIVKIVSVESFQWYIELMIKVQEDNKAKYNVLYLEAMKKYIDYIISHNQDVADFLAQQEMSIFEQNEELNNYFEEQKNSRLFQNLNDINVIINVMKESKRKRGYGSSDEELLNSISIKQHIEWMKKSAEYLETSFGFVTWIRGFAGTKPFEKAYQNMADAIKELGEIPEYKNKLELMIQYFDKK